MNKFEQLGLKKEIIKAIEELHFETPTDVQVGTIPFVLEGKDVLAKSSTGSGKTFAFGAGILQNINPGLGVQALILTPTRELAEQILQSFSVFGKYLNVRTTAIYGGVSITPQMKDLTNADIVVGTPGRIMDHMNRKTIDFSNLHFFVLDEADRMLDMGFFDDVKRILKSCPKKMQTLFFSATIPPDIKKLAQTMMPNHEYVGIDSYVDPKKLNQVYYNITPNMKFSLLVHLLNLESSGLVMVFCNSRRSTDFVAKNLKLNKIDALAIHGGLTQARRNEVMERFNSPKPYVLVCTDVAARGLDVPGVSHVYNYELPADSKQYIHRIGRTARAGKTGKVINLLSELDHDAFRKIQRDYDVSVACQERPFIERVNVVMPQRTSEREGFLRRGPSNQQRKGSGFRPRNDSKPRNRSNSSSTNQGGFKPRKNIQ